MDKFEAAAKGCYRYPTGKGGEYTTEQLFKLDLPALNVVAQTIDDELSTSKKSFIAPKTSGSRILATKLEIVVHIIESKQAEKERKEKIKEVKENLTLLEELEREDAMTALKNLSPAEKKQKIAALRAELES